MKILLGQIDIVPGNPEKNFEKMKSIVEDAKKNKVDLVVFPEMSIGGYFIADKYTDDAYCDWLMSYNDKMLELSNGIAIVYGNVCVDHNPSSMIWRPNKDGRSRKYNAAYVVQNGNYCTRGIGDDSLACLPIGVQIKTLLPNYRIFDDERYFLSFKDFCLDYGLKLEDALVPFKIWSNSDNCFRKIGIELCEDLFFTDYRYNNEGLNPTKFLIKNGAEYIVNISCSPWTYGKNKARHNRIKEIKEDIEKANLPFRTFVYVNNVGSQNNGKNIIVFDGASTVYNEQAEVIALANNNFEEENLIFDTKEKYPVLPVYPEKDMIEQKHDAIICGLKHYKDTMGTETPLKWVLGLSGGVDSAVSASLLVEAFGKENVIAINMPTKNNSKKTKEVAKYIAEQLGIRYEIVPIGPIFRTVNKTLNISFNPATSLNLENEQARIRGSAIIAGIAARENALFTNNGNKVEAALGYCTAYGDLNGAICPLGDLLKTEVFELAKFINKKNGKEIIPEILFPDELYRFQKGKIVSGPELIRGQVSQILIGYHDYLIAAFMDYRKKSPEDILQFYLDGVLEVELGKYGMRKGIIERYGLNDPLYFLSNLEWVCKKISGNTWKRVQFPPICISSKSSWGFDVRESILPFIKSERYIKLEMDIRSRKIAT